MEDAGRRKRGRGGRGGKPVSSSGRPPRRDGARPDRGERREERSGERPHRPRQQPAAPLESGAAAPIAASEIPGIGEQPDVSFDHIADMPAAVGVAHAEPAQATEEGARRRRRRGGRGRNKGREADGSTISSAHPADAAHEEARTTPSASQPRDERAAPPQTPAPRPQREIREPQRDAPPRHAEARPTARPQPAAHQPSAQASAPSERRAHSHARENDRTRGAAQGFADNVPAFLRRPVPKRQKVASE